MATRHNVVGYGGSVHHVACGRVHLGLVLRDVLTAESIYTSDENSEGAQRRLHEYTDTASSSKVESMSSTKHISIRVVNSTHL